MSKMSKQTADLVFLEHVLGLRSVIAAKLRQLNRPRAQIPKQLSRFA